MKTIWISGVDVSDGGSVSGHYVDADIAQSLYDMLVKIVQFQEAAYGSGMKLHMGMIQLAEDARKTLEKADEEDT